MKYFLLLILLNLPFVNTCHAQDVDPIFNKIKELLAQSNYPAAFKELEWARKEIEKKHQDKLIELLPETILTYKKLETKDSKKQLLSDVQMDYDLGPAFYPLHVNINSNFGKGNALANMNCDEATASFSADEVFRVKSYPSGIKTNNFGKTKSTTLSVCVKGGSVSFLIRNGNSFIKNEDEKRKMADPSILKKVAEGFNYTKIEKYLMSAE